MSLMQNNLIQQLSQSPFIESQNYKIIQKQQDNDYQIVRIENDIITLKSNEYTLNQKDANQFNLSVDEFENIFSDVSFVMEHINYNFSWMSLECNYQKEVVQKEIIECSSTISFDVQKETHIYISICQAGLNLVLPEKSANYLEKFALVRVIIAKVGDNDNYQFICGDLSYKRQVTLEISLPPSSYVIMTQLYFPLIIQQQLKRDFRLKLYEQKATIQFFAPHLPTNIKFLQINFVDLERKLISSIALALQSPLNTRNYDDQGEPKITVTTIMTIGILIFYYCNQGDSILNEQVEFQEKRNLVKCYGEYSEVTKSFVSQIYPSNEYLVVFKYDPIEAMNPQGNFSYKCHIKANLQPAGNQQKQEDNKTQGTLSLQKQTFYSEFENQSIIQNFGSNENKFSTYDLIKFLQDHGKITRRVWEENPIEIYVYIYQHFQGSILLFQNQSSHNYEENINFELKNLEIKCQLHSKKDVLQFVLEPYSHLLVYLDVIDSNSPFAYKLQSTYKYYNQ